MLPVMFVCPACSCTDCFEFSDGLQCAHCGTKYAFDELDSDFGGKYEEEENYDNV